MRKPNDRRLRYAWVLPLLCTALVAPPPSIAAESTALTVYSTARPGAVPAELYRPTPDGNPGRSRNIPGYAVIKQERELELARGRGELRFVDVAALIDPTTVHFESLTDPDGTQVLEQNYQFDLVSQQKLIERFLDREITVEQAHGDTIESFTGRLLSASGGLVLQDGRGRVRALRSWSGIQFPDLPGGLITRPTLVWDIAAKRGGKHDTRISYQTEGMTWWADYNIVFAPGEDENSGVLDVGAWVSIINRSGAGFTNAKLKLVAGDVHRAELEAAAYPRVQRMALAESAVPGFEEKAFFEYHLYTLGRPTTLPDNSTKQIELFDAARGVPADKILVYRGQAGVGYYGSPITDRGFGTQSNKKVDVYLRFANAARNGLGVPLPAGRIRVNQVDPDDGSLEFIGEDVIDHTPKNEEVLIQLGSAFDVVGERKQTDFRVDTSRKWMEETIEIELRNRKDEPVEVLVKENLYRWVNWKMLEASHEYQKVDARTIHFPVRLAAGEEAKLTYRVRYTW